MLLKPVLHSFRSLQPLQLLRFAESKQVMMLVMTSSLATSIGLNDPSIDSSIVAFIVSFIISNALPSLAVKSDKIVSFGWSNALIASLVMSMLGSDSSSGDDSAPSTIANAIPMLVSFISGTIGSFVGSIIAFNVVKKFCGVNILVSDLAICASCLTASYIGGTANFFEAANTLVKNGNSTSKLLNIVAGLDIFVMVCYFMVLLGIHQVRVKEEVQTTKSMREVSIFDIVKPGVLGIVVSVIASTAQKTVAIPGVSVTIATILALIIRKSDFKWVQSISSDSKNLCSAFYLAIFYSILGGGLQFNDLLVGIPILSLISLTLAIHLGVMFLSRFLWNYYFPKHRIDLDSLVLSSNACIGGAATSAGMAAQIGRNDLTILASSLGILGYVIGTHIGLYCIKFMKY